MNRSPTRLHLGLVIFMACALLNATLHVSAAEQDYRLGSQGEVLEDRAMYSIGGSAVGSP